MSILVFKNIEAYNKYFGSVDNNKINYIEHKTFKGYSKNRILITAEHAFTERIPDPRYGKGSYVGLGDKNTDILARMAAFSSSSAYIIPWASRYKVDFARDPRLIGKDTKLLVVVSQAKIPIKKYTTVHNDKNYLYLLIRYHNMIRDMKPKFVLSFHGMHKRHRTDISIGAGTNCSYLGGKEQARAFVTFVRNKTNEKLNEMGFKQPLDIRLSTLFLGTRNYMLNKFTKNATGCQVEFNLRGRTSEKRGMPIPKFQIAAQMIPECVKNFNWKS